jgi:hypothetical protein
MDPTPELPPSPLEEQQAQRGVSELDSIVPPLSPTTMLVISDPIHKLQELPTERQEAQATSSEPSGLTHPQNDLDSSGESIGKQVWSWVVVGAIDLFILAGGIAFMTSGHPIAADVFFVAGAVLFLLRFWTWEDAQKQPRRKKRALFVAITALSIGLLACAVWWNHKINPTPLTAALPLSSAPGIAAGGARTTNPDADRSAASSGTPVHPPTRSPAHPAPPKGPKTPVTNDILNVSDVVDYGAGLMVISNPSSKSMYALNVKVNITEPGDNGTDSRSFAIDHELPPNQYISIPVDQVNFEETTQPYATDWNMDWRITAANFPGCVNLIFFTPSSSQLKQIVDHYASIHMLLPLGDASGTLTYRGGSPPVTRDVIFPLKAVLVKMKDCPTRR